MRNVITVILLCLVGCSTQKNLEGGQTALETQNWDAACRAFQPVVDSHWPVQIAFYGLATAKIGLGDTAAAQEAIEQWLLVDPMDWHAHLRAGQLALSQGLRDEAALHFVTSRVFCEYANEIQEVDAWLAKLQPPTAGTNETPPSGAPAP